MPTKKSLFAVVLIKERSMNIHYQLATLKKGDSSTANYFHKFTHLTDTLAVVDQPLPPHEALSFLLANLGSDYDSLVTSVKTQVHPMSLDDLYGHMLSHELCLAQHQPTVDLSNHSTNASTSCHSSTGLDYNWYLDSGATHHVTHDLANLNLCVDEYQGSDQICAGSVTRRLLLQGPSKHELYPFPPLSTKRLSSPRALLGEHTSFTNWHSRLEPPPSSSTLPSFTPNPPNTLTHPMLTQSKNNINKTKLPTDKTVRYPLPKALLTTTDLISSLPEPTCFTATSKDPQWRKAMNIEFEALLKNRTWALVPPHPKQNVVGCKWVFQIKRHADGSIERYKARLVAKEFHQQLGIDYDETYSPVIKPTTVRTVLFIPISTSWSVQQIDIQNTFLHGNLSKEVYMIQPLGFQHPQFLNHVCKLQKAIYGLKQKPRAWFSRLSSQLLDLDFHSSKSDTSLFICRNSLFPIYVLIYVDDIIITSSSNQAINKLLYNLKSDFVVKQLSPLKFFLGIEVIPSPNGVLISQQRYIKDILSRTKMLDTKPVNTPMASSTSLSAHEGEPFPDHTLFRSTIGALQYLSITSPDIAFAFRLHIYHSSCHTLHAFCDANWAGNKDDRRSTGSFCIFLGKNLISWSCRKQATVARSSTEAEYKALANTTAKIKTKHIEIDFHFVRDMVAAKQLNVCFISSTDQLADVLTKPISSSRFALLWAKLNVLSVSLGLRERVKDKPQLSTEDHHQASKKIKQMNQTLSNPTT
uniref:Reverse transcriptase Ty1/copia-type domain-containing protein n=1 Tax=Fagus sylvatica TaxID=28930 RepID=A0A2N9IVC3_FAGSY